MVSCMVQSRFAETRFAETLTLTLTLSLTLNPNFGESGFGESGRHLMRSGGRFCLEIPMMSFTRDRPNIGRH